MEASSVGTFTRGLERIANQIPVPTHDPDEKDEYLLRLLGGLHVAAVSPAGGIAATARAAALQLPPQLPLNSQPSTARVPSTSSAAPAATSIAKTASAFAGPRDTQAGRLALRFGGMPTAAPAALAAGLKPAAGPAAAGAWAHRLAAAASMQRLGLAAHCRARELLLAQQGEFNSQVQSHLQHCAAVVVSCSQGCG